MELRSVILLLFVNSLSIHARHERTVKNILRILRRAKKFPKEDLTVIGTAKDPEDLPEAEPIHPGHTLIKPTLNMLRSQIKFPLRDVSALVYGNLDNVGITYGKTPYRILNSGFRKMNDNLLGTLFNAIKKVDKHKRNHDPLPTIVFKGPIVLPRDLHGLTLKQNIGTDDSRELENENRANEMLDVSENESDDHTSYRRKGDCASSRAKTSSSSMSSESDYEKNPGNPFTVKKGKYYENWLWNHKFDGLHMNISPHAPKFQSMGPAGGDLFFNRKWWYFNQDDYKPLG